jgi:hypothetical protein
LQPFNARVFLDLSALLLLYFIIRGIIYMFRTYPKARAEWQARQARENRKNEPRAAAAAAPIRPATSAKANVAATTTTAATTPVKAAQAKVATTAGTVATAETNVISPATEVRQGLSERGQKRRDRKRSKR